MKALIQTAGLVTALWGISIPLAGLVPSSPLWAAAVKTPAKNAVLQKLFRRGMDAYEAKSYDDAVDLFSQLLQKQPDYAPAKIQLARSLYQLKRFTESYKLFQQVEDISILEPDPSYEYGQSAFRSDDYANALKAFRNVPNGHPLFDLAGYYGGIAAFKQGEYQLALDLFEQAVVLPSKLLKSQKLYQKEAEKLLIQQQKQELQNTVPPATNRPNGAGTAEAAEPPKPFRFLSAKRQVQFIPRASTQTRQRVDNQSSEHQIKSGTLQLDLGAERNASAQKAPHWIFQADISVLGIEGGTDEVLVLPDARTEQERFLLQKNKPRGLFCVGVGAAVEWSIATGTSLGLNLGGRGLVPGGADEPQGAGIPQVGIFLAQKNNNLETLLKTDFHGYIYDGDFLFSNARQVGRIEYVAMNRIRFGLQGELSEYAYNVDRVNGPDWQGRILSEIGYGHDQGFRAAIGAFFEITEGQRFHDLGEVSVIEFNHNTFGARFRSDVTLVKAVDIGLEASVMDRSTTGLSPSNENTIAAQRAIFPTVVSTLSLHINIHTGF
ncbi:MAG TPA: tetratricopeptide repeat protein [Oligoflexus sp.]|uniref:tetratricopeptide repeat protein n=1 Tax=Oligoflexus sp. TaxID=1971216 RepID=UPI002D51FB36|nr:tetratricopeptide repeat protein [Oligoflexus sp.]HYX33050.1 tetratricopeptide repeat protein [Oligoflexus sp.]